MKKGYIFTLDVFVASIILIVGFIAIIGFMFYSPEKDKTDKLATEIISVMAEIKLYELCDFSSGCSCVYPSIDALCSEIKNPRLSILEFLGQLYHDSIDKSFTAAIIDEIFIESQIVPMSYDLQVLLHDPGFNSQMQLYPD